MTPTIPAYLRDSTISYGAIGILLELTSAGHDETGVFLHDLVSMTPDGESAVIGLLADLAGAGYVRSDRVYGQVAYWATGKAYRTTAADCLSSASSWSSRAHRGAEMHADETEESRADGWHEHPRSGLMVQTRIEGGRLIELAVKPAPGRRLESAALRKISTEQLVAQAMQDGPCVNRTIVDPGGYRKPDGFYRRIAEVFIAELADGNLRPAQTIAAHAGVPVPTVHRWLREARTRGIALPTDGRVEG